MSTTETKPTPPDVNEIVGWRSWVLLPLGLLTRIWGWSLRFEIDKADLRAVSIVDRPVAFVLWHNRLFITSEIFRRYRQGRPIYALVSASKDGAWLAAFFRLVGIRSIRGSSSKLGREAATALVQCMQAGNDIGITPDGPRGPRYDFKAGGVVVTRRANATALLLGADYESAWQLKSWDRFYLPKPFSKVRIYCQAVEPDEMAERSAADALRKRLLAINPDRAGNPTSRG